MILIGFLSLSPLCVARVRLGGSPPDSCPDKVVGGVVGGRLSKPPNANEITISNKEGMGSFPTMPLDPDQLCDE